MSTPPEAKRRKSNPLDEAAIELSEKIENEVSAEVKPEEEEDNIEVQFANWKTNTTILYDFVSRKELEWPSLSIDFGDFHDENASKKVLNQVVCVGTHTSDKEPNYLYVCDVLFPLEKVPQEKCVYKVNDSYEGFEFCEEEKKFNIKSKIAHKGEVNRIKFLPVEKEKHFVVTKAVTGNLHLFDIRKHKIETADDSMRPEVTFDGNNKDGFGLDFNKKTKNIFTCGNDGLITVYSYEDLTSQTVHPLYKVNYKALVNDVAVTNDPHLFLACAENGYILVYDLRLKTTEPASQVLGQQVPVNTVAFNHFTGLFASGSDNGKIKIWDFRKLTDPQQIIHAHEEAIIRLNFSPNDASLLAAASANRFINIYDLNKTVDDIDDVDLSDGPAELIFSHGGHTHPITDFNWNRHKRLKLFIGSTSEDNTLQFWQMKTELLDDATTSTETE